MNIGQTCSTTQVRPMHMMEDVEIAPEPERRLNAMLMAFLLCSKPTIPTPPGHPRSWTAQKVKTWMKSEGLGAWRKKFKDVDGRDLLNMEISALDAIVGKPVVNTPILAALNKLRSKWRLPELEAGFAMDTPMESQPLSDVIVRVSHVPSVLQQHESLEVVEEGPNEGADATPTNIAQALDSARGSDLVSICPAANNAFALNFRPRRKSAEDTRASIEVPQLTKRSSAGAVEGTRPATSAPNSMLREPGIGPAAGLDDESEEVRKLVGEVLNKIKQAGTEEEQAAGAAPGTEHANEQMLYDLHTGATTSVPITDTAGSANAGEIVAAANRRAIVTYDMGPELSEIKPLKRRAAMQGPSEAVETSTMIAPSFTAPSFTALTAPPLDPHALMVASKTLALAVPKEPVLFTKLQAPSLPEWGKALQPFASEYREEDVCAYLDGCIGKGFGGGLAEAVQTEPAYGKVFGAAVRLDHYAFQAIVARDNCMKAAGLAADVLRILDIAWKKYSAALMMGVPGVRFVPCATLLAIANHLDALRHNVLPFTKGGWLLEILCGERCKEKFDTDHNAIVDALKDVGFDMLPNGRKLVRADYKDVPRAVRRLVKQYGTGSLTVGAKNLKACELGSTGIKELTNLLELGEIGSEQAQAMVIDELNKLPVDAGLEIEVYYNSLTQGHNMGSAHHEAFEWYDRENHTGYIDLPRFQNMLADLGLLEGKSEDEAKAFVAASFKAADVKGAGVLDKDAFCAYYATLTTSKARQQLRARMGLAAENELRQVFLAFASFGSRVEITEIDNARFMKMAKECALTCPQLTPTDVDIIFVKSKSMGSRRLNFEQFLNALMECAEKRKVLLEDIVKMIIHSGGPVAHATKPESVRLHDDKSTYTGVYAKGGPTSVDPPKPHDLANLLDRSQADVRGVKIAAPPKPQLMIKSVAMGGFAPTRSSSSMLALPAPDFKSRIPTSTSLTATPLALTTGSDHTLNIYTTKFPPFHPGVLFAGARTQANSWKASDVTIAICKNMMIHARDETWWYDDGSTAAGAVKAVEKASKGPAVAPAKLSVISMTSRSRRTSINSSSAVMTNGDRLKQMFVLFATFGSHSVTTVDAANKVTMDSSKFQKLCRECRLIDPANKKKGLNSTRADLIFTKVKQQGHSRITFVEFKKALELVAEVKGMSIVDICSAITKSEGPLLTRIVSGIPKPLSSRQSTPPLSPRLTAKYI